MNHYTEINNYIIRIWQDVKDSGPWDESMAPEIRYQLREKFGPSIDAGHKDYVDAALQLAEGMATA